MIEHNLSLPEMLESSCVMKDTISVQRDRLLYAGNHISDYFVVQTGRESVVVVALSATNEILVTREYRHAVKKVVLGLPGGLVDDNEDPIDAAHRELREEAGALSDRIELIGSCFPLPGLLDQRMHIACAHNVELSDTASLEATEAIQSSFMTFDALYGMIAQGCDVDGILLTALQRYSIRCNAK